MHKIHSSNSIDVRVKNAIIDDRLSASNLDVTDNVTTRSIVASEIEASNIMTRNEFGYWVKLTPNNTYDLPQELQIISSTFRDPFDNTSNTFIDNNEVVVSNASNETRVEPGVITLDTSTITKQKVDKWDQLIDNSQFDWNDFKIIDSAGRKVSFSMDTTIPVSQEQKINLWNPSSGSFYEFLLGNTTIMQDVYRHFYSESLKCMLGKSTNFNGNGISLGWNNQSLAGNYNISLGRNNDLRSTTGLMKLGDSDITSCVIEGITNKTFSTTTDTFYTMGIDPVTKQVGVYDRAAIDDGVSIDTTVKNIYIGSTKDNNFAKSIVLGCNSKATNASGNNIIIGHDISNNFTNSISIGFSGGDNMVAIGNGTMVPYFHYLAMSTSSVTSAAITDCVVLDGGRLRKTNRYNFQAPISIQSTQLTGTMVSNMVLKDNLRIGTGITSDATNIVLGNNHNLTGTSNAIVLGSDTTTTAIIKGVYDKNLTTETTARRMVVDQDGTIGYTTDTANEPVIDTDPFTTFVERSIYNTHVCRKPDGTLAVEPKNLFKHTYDYATWYKTTTASQYLLVQKGESFKISFGSTAGSIGPGSLFKIRFCVPVNETTMGQLEFEGFLNLSKDDATHEIVNAVHVSCGKNLRLINDWYRTYEVSIRNLGSGNLVFTNGFLHMRAIHSPVVDIIGETQTLTLTA